jgi:hypothetical protein
VLKANSELLDITVPPQEVLAVMGSLGAGSGSDDQ